jgi:hypothetical protein
MDSKRMAKLEQRKGVLNAMKVHKPTHPIETRIELIFCRRKHQCRISSGG